MDMVVFSVCFCYDNMVLVQGQKKKKRASFGQGFFQ